MSKVIEISDSEDEQEQSQLVTSSIDSMPAASQYSAVVALVPELKPFSVAVAAAAASPAAPSTTTQPVAAATVPVPVPAPAPSPTPTEPPIPPASVMSRAAVASTARKHSRRKSMHQPICVSPEIEFETIALDDDGETVVGARRAGGTASATAATAAAGEKQQRPQQQQQHSNKAKPYKTTPKILTSKQPATTEMVMDNACTELNLSEQTQAQLRRIAEDRVRVNFLLAAYNMPEIQFSLYTSSHVLEFQLEERVKQRRMRYAEMARLQEVKRRRSLAQSSTKTST